MFYLTSRLHLQNFDETYQVAQSVAFAPRSTKLVDSNTDSPNYRYKTNVLVCACRLVDDRAECESSDSITRKSR